jgi:hypothetical protein
MFPMLWFWAPQYHLPLSGAVAQDFFSTIRPQAGNAEVERDAAGVASYGRQLGLISEVLLSLTGQQDTVSAAKGEESLDRLKKIYLEVEDVKRRHKRKRFDSAVTLLEDLQEHDPAALALLLQRFAATPAAQARLAAPAR